MALCWDTELSKKEGSQKTLSFEEKPAHPVSAYLAEHGDSHINTIALALNTPVHQPSTILFELALENHVRALPGGISHLND